MSLHTNAPKKCCMNDGASLGFSHFRTKESIELAAAKFTSTRNMSRVDTYMYIHNNIMSYSAILEYGL
jgi:hypothetical protein